MIEDLWYKNTVIYSLDPERFMDANGEGVTRRTDAALDYQDSLDIETI